MEAVPILEERLKKTISVAAVLVLSTALAARAQDAREITEDNERIEERVRREKARAEIEKARAEAERARAEAERAKAEAERARIEAEKARLELEHLRSGAAAAPEAIPPATVPAVAQPGEPAAGVHTHDGLFLRMTAGPGFGAYRGTGHITSASGVEISDPSDEGSQGGGSFCLGGAVWDNLMLHGDLWLSLVSSKRRNDLQQDFGLVVLGMGVTYYWMPLNIYLTGSIGMANSFLVLGDDEPGTGDDAGNTATGVGMYVQAGKEWWVSDNWGLGVAIQAEYSYGEDEDTGLIFRHGGAKVLFSATYQ